jgi:hypothetical protein
MSISMPRRALEPGDYVMCAHGCPAYVVENLPLGEQSFLRLELHKVGSGIVRTELYPASTPIEVLEIAS